MTKDFTLTARILVDQHYAAGPDRMKQAIAQALSEAAGSLEPDDEPRRQLLREVSELEKTSQRGSE